jgi:hypothetical protein
MTCQCETNGFPCAAGARGNHNCKTAAAVRSWIRSGTRPAPAPSRRSAPIKPMKAITAPVKPFLPGPWPSNALVAQTNAGLPIVWQAAPSRAQRAEAVQLVEDALRWLPVEVLAQLRARRTSVAIFEGETFESPTGNGKSVLGACVEFGSPAGTMIGIASAVLSSRDGRATVCHEVAHALGASSESEAWRRAATWLAGSGDAGFCTARAEEVS